MHLHKGSRRPRRGLLFAALLATGGLVAAGCGDDDEASTGDDTATTAAADATSDTAATDGEASSGVAEAAAVVEEFLRQPTSLDLDTPVEGEIPEGLTIYFVSCGSEACTAEVDIIREATDILGWTLEAIVTDGSPQQIQNAWEQVVREAPDGVIYTATPRSQIDRYITQAAANGTAVAACCIVEEPTDGIIWTTSTPAQLGVLSEPMAAWVVDDAAKAGNDQPGVLYVDLPDFPILSSLATAFEENLASFCPDCPFEKLDIGLADIQNASSLVVSALRSNRDLQYVVQSTDGPFVGLPAAIRAAGLDDVRIFGEGPTTANMANIASGDQAATMAFPFYEVMFGAVDAIARFHAGDEVIAGFLPPNWILTADNLPSSSEFFPVVPDVVEHFTELWGKG